MYVSLLAVIVIGAIACLGSLMGLQYLFGIVLPLLAAVVFVVGLVWRMIYWSKSPVPFCIPTTGGQEKSLDWIKPNRLDNPTSTAGVIGRMLLEVLTFRSLFRNTEADIRANVDENGPQVVYYSSKWLWLFALAFHYCFLIIFIRHFRFFLEPVPFVITLVEGLDGMFQMGVPRMYLSSIIILGALAFLFTRRLVNTRMRYLSLANDYFPLLLIISVILSGMYMRYIGKVDVASVKTLLMGLVTLHPVLPANIGISFFVHVTFVSVLLMYFPFSKLVHMPGIFFSPTRNMVNDSRRVRHVNPWNPPKKYRTYMEYEDDFREAMFEAGLPLEKQPDKADAE